MSLFHSLLLLMTWGKKGDFIWCPRLVNHTLGLLQQWHSIQHGPIDMVMHYMFMLTYIVSFQKGETTNAWDEHNIWKMGHCCSVLIVLLCPPVAHRLSADKQSFIILTFRLLTFLLQKRDRATDRMCVSFKRSISSHHVIFSMHRQTKSCICIWPTLLWWYLYQNTATVPLFHLTFWMFSPQWVISKLLWWMTHILNSLQHP